MVLEFHEVKRAATHVWTPMPSFPTGVVWCHIIALSCWFHGSLQVYHWTSDGRADLHFSFYLVVLSTVLFGVNIILVFCAGVDCKPIKYRTNVNEKALDGVMMYWWRHSWLQVAPSMISVTKSDAQQTGNGCGNTKSSAGLIFLCGICSGNLMTVMQWSDRSKMYKWYSESHNDGKTMYLRCDISLWLIRHDFTKKKLLHVFSICYTHVIA